MQVCPHAIYGRGGAYFIDKKTFIEMLKNQYRNGLDFFKYIFSRKGINTCSFNSNFLKHEPLKQRWFPCRSQGIKTPEKMEWRKKIKLFLNMNYRYFFLTFDFIKSCFDVLNSNGQCCPGKGCGTIIFLFGPILQNKY